MNDLNKRYLVVRRVRLLVRKGLRRWWRACLLVGALGLIGGIYIFAALADRESLRESYPKSNYSLIEEGLFLGGILSEPPPGVRAVLNVCETNDPYTAEVHRWEPIPDLGPAPELEWLRRQVEFIDEQRQAGRPVYVHCRAGINRSATVAAAYLMWRDRLTRDQALEVIRGKRPRICPFEVYQKYLSDWEKSLQ
jgi:hypothetical protein